MNKTLFVAGSGPGISAAVAERFGKAGFQVALAASDADRAATGVRALEARGVRARGFAADLADPAQVRDVVERVRRELGPIDAVAWITYRNRAGDVLAADPTELRADLDVATTGLLAAVREALPDLRARKGAVLVANGGLGLFDEQMDAYGAQGVMGLAMANSAKHKLVGMLAHKLRDDGVYVGEVMVLNLVKGTASDPGNATLEPAAIAERFWELYANRAPTFAQIG